MDAHELVNALTAKKIGIGSTINHDTFLDSKRNPRKFKITSIKTWQKDRNRLKIGLKYGLYDYVSIDSVAEFMEHFSKVIA